jgi:adenylate kinase family enzyme
VSSLFFAATPSSNAAGLRISLSLRCFCCYLRLRWAAPGFCGEAMERVLVIGSPGGGKTTLSRELGELLDLPVYHLDKLFWKPGWALSDDASFRAAQRNLISEPKWIIDGNYDRTLDVRLPHADTVIHLDFPRHICLRRILKRIRSNWHKTRSDMAPGCPERLDISFLRFVWRFHRDHRPRILGLLEQYRGRIDLVTLSRPSDVAGFLRRIREMR